MAKYKDYYDKINTEIEAGSLWKAIALLRVLIKKAADNKLNLKLDEIESTYRYMTDYLLNDSVDPQRESVYDRVVSNLHSINDTLLHNNLIDTAPELYYATARLHRMNPTDLQTLFDEYRKYESVDGIMAESGQYDASLLKKKERALTDLFEAVWVSGDLNKQDKSIIESVVTDVNEAFELRSQIVAALFFALLARFDSAKLSVLLTAAESIDDEAIAARALVCASLIMVRYPARVVEDTELRSRLELWEDSLILYSRMRTVIQALLKAYDTDRLTREMNETVMPEFIKMQPTLRKIFGDAKNKGNMSIEDLEFNPEWEEMLAKSGLQDKLQSLQELQEQGGDIMMAPFSGLKRFPFFNTVSNWFLPFTGRHSEFKQNEMIEMLMPFAETRDGMICDSDKFSLFLSVGMANVSAIKDRVTMMTEHLNQLKDQAAENNLANPVFVAETESFVRDMYRFFRLFNRREEFPDPFDKPFNPVELPIIGDFIFDSEMTRLMMEFFLKGHYYGQALACCLKLISTEEPDETLYQKAAFCLMEMGHFEEALESLKRAELLNADSQWLNSSMATCLNAIGDGEGAVKYLRKLEEANPEDAAILFNLGLTLSEIGEKEEALKYFYKANYLHPEHTYSMRGIAWTEFLLGNFEKSLEYSDRLINSDSTDANDFMNAGTACFAMGRYGDAYKYYKQSVDFREGDDRVEAYNDFRKELSEDLESIEELGLSMKDLTIILDKVRTDSVNS